MGLFKLSAKQKLKAVMCISLTFLVAELVVSFYTSSIALIADAFHYMNDLIGFAVALGALVVSEQDSQDLALSYGWARAPLLGAFFNGAFLLALGLSIFLQSIERFIFIKYVENPKLVLMMGCIGFVLNIASATLLHGHGNGHEHGNQHRQGHVHSQPNGHNRRRDQSPTRNEQVYTEKPQPKSAASLEAGLTESDHTGEYDSSTKSIEDSTDNHSGHNCERMKLDLEHSGRDLGMLGVFIHVVGDALNNIGVIIVALVIWLTENDTRYYADPVVSMGIGMMILLSSFPVIKDSGRILLQSAPHGIKIAELQHDLETVYGPGSVQHLHVWRLNQKRTIASMHIAMADDHQISDFAESVKGMSECLQRFGITEWTMQPELASLTENQKKQSTITSTNSSTTDISSLRKRRERVEDRYTMNCGSSYRSHASVERIPIKPFGLCSNA